MSTEYDRDNSDRITRLEAQVEAIENWRKEFLPRFEALESLVITLKEASARQFVAVLTVLVSGFLTVSAGLLYIILNHVLLHP